MKFKKYGVWYCGDCEENLMVEVDKFGGGLVHCCFHCGSSEKHLVEVDKFGGGLVHCCFHCGSSEKHYSIPLSQLNPEDLKDLDG